MRYKMKRFVCYAAIIVLLPYIVTVFLNGREMGTSAAVKDTYVTVEAESGATKMTMEEYGIGVLAKEISPSFKKEALKTQAILVRTSILREMEEGGSGAVLEDSFWTRQQMEDAWGSAEYSSNYARLEEAWKATEGQIVAYEGKPANTPFFRLSNGSTRDGKEVLGSEAYPYLKIVECPLDIEAPEQIQTITIDQMDAKAEKYDTAGYVLRVRVGEESVSGEEFRRRYHLASSCFTIQEYNGKLRITTRGVGHGLGMSQYTANEMAKEGKTAEEILNYFFAGTEIKEVAEVVTGEESTDQETAQGM